MSKYIYTTHYIYNITFIVIDDIIYGIHWLNAEITIVLDSWHATV